MSDIPSNYGPRCIYTSGDGESCGGHSSIHLPTGLSVDCLRTLSLPSAMIWVNTPLESNKGAAHTCEHVLLGKGSLGRRAASIEQMVLGQSSATTHQTHTIYHFNSTCVDLEAFVILLEARLTALLLPDALDEEIRREVCHVGVEEEERGRGGKFLVPIEKGTVYGEMVGAFELANQRVFHQLYRMQYGDRHPLAQEQGGTPEGIREFTVEDFRHFHDRCYRLNSMGIIFAMPDHLGFHTLLVRLHSILVDLQRRVAARSLGAASSSEQRPGASLSQPPLAPLYNDPILDESLPAPAPYVSGAIEIIPFPHQSDSKPSLVVLAWPPLVAPRANFSSDNRDTAGITNSLFDETVRRNAERLLLDVFLEALGDGDTSLVHRAVVAAADLAGAENDIKRLKVSHVRAWTMKRQGDPSYVSFEGVAANAVSVESVAALRRVVLDNVRHIGSASPGSDALVTFNREAVRRLAQRRRNLRVFLNSPTAFGIRGTHDQWLEHLRHIRRSLPTTPIFRENTTAGDNARAPPPPRQQLSLCNEFELAERVLSSGKNVWSGLIQKWGLLEPCRQPFGVAAKASSALQRREVEQKLTRLRNFVAGLQRRDGQAATRTGEDSHTRDGAGAGVLPSPPTWGNKEQVGEEGGEDAVGFQSALDQSALKAYKASFDVATKSLADEESGDAGLALDYEPPLPLSLDEPLARRVEILDLIDGARARLEEGGGGGRRWGGEKLPGTAADNGQLVVAPFRGITLGSVALAFRIAPDTVPTQDISLLAVFPDLLTEVGFVFRTPSGEQRLSHAAAQQGMAKEILGLNCYVKADSVSGRVELFIRCSGSVELETLRAVDWLEAALFHADDVWTVSNLPRIREVVESRLSDARATTQQRPEFWADSIFNAVWRHDRPLFLISNCFMTRAHALHRLCWQLRPPLSNSVDMRRFCTALEGVSDVLCVYLGADKTCGRRESKNGPGMRDSSFFCELRQAEGLDTVFELVSQVVCGKRETVALPATTDGLGGSARRGLRVGERMACAIATALCHPWRPTRGDGDGDGGVPSSACFRDRVPQPCRRLITTALSDLQKTLCESAVGSRLGDCMHLLDCMREDLMVDPKIVLRRLRLLLSRIRTVKFVDRDGCTVPPPTSADQSGRAHELSVRACVVCNGSGGTKDALVGRTRAIVSKLLKAQNDNAVANGGGRPHDEEAFPSALARAAKRLGQKTLLSGSEDHGGARPRLVVGLLIESMKQSVAIHACRRGATYRSTAEESACRGNTAKRCQLQRRHDLIRFLSALQFGGGGAHSFFMRTWAAGLAYSSGVGASASTGWSRHYADHCPNVANTLEFVLETAREAVEETERHSEQSALRLQRYALAQAFAPCLAGRGYIERGEAMALSIANGLTADVIRRFRSAIAQLAGHQLDEPIATKNAAFAICAAKECAVTLARSVEAQLGPTLADVFDCEELRAPARTIRPELRQDNSTMPRDDAENAEHGSKRNGGVAKWEEATKPLTGGDGEMYGISLVLGCDSEMRSYEQWRARHPPVGSAKGAHRALHVMCPRDFWLVQSEPGRGDCHSDGAPTLQNARRLLLPSPSARIRLFLPSAADNPVLVGASVALLIAAGLVYCWRTRR